MDVVGIIALLLGLFINGVDNLIQWSKLNRAAAILSSELKNMLWGRFSLTNFYYSQN